MAELLKVREITIDTMQYKDFATKEEELKVMRFYQNDLNSAKLLINVTHDKVVTDLSTATKVQIAFQKPDGKRVFQDVQNVNQMQGKYYVVLSTQTLIAYGNVVAQLRLTFPNNKVIETCKFVFAVDESIMSDNAMESTNEFPVIQKAIEAGKKLEGVDIDGIIAAGAKADAALPKTGGTMTGDLTIKKDNTGFQVKNNNDVGLAHLVGATGEYYWYSTVNKTPLKYNVSSDTLTVNSATNLLKKAGDTMTGPLVLDSAPTIRGVGATFDMRPYNGTVYSKGFRHTVNTANNYYAVAPIDENGVATWSNQLQFDGADGTLTVSNLKTRKDGRTNIPLSSEATAPDVNYILAAVRVNNVVTLKGAVTLNANATGVIVATLPPDLKPAGGNLSIYTPTADLSTNVQVFVNGTSGAIAFSSNAKGKRVDFVITYVI